ncbi:MAG: lysylphosphatidylglycerol synthase transmembrane domain-containing protein [Acidimicrobiales bacterium]
MSDLADPVDEERPRRSKRLVHLLQLLAVALVIHLFVVPQIGGFTDAVETIRSVRPEWLVAALGLYAGSLLVYALLLEILLPDDMRPGFGRLFGVVLASTGLNHVIPGGAATTAAVNYRLLAGTGVARSELGVALTIQGLGSAVVLNVLLWLALLVAIPTRGLNPLYTTAAILGVVLFSLFASAVVGLTRGRVTAIGWGRRIASRIPGAHPDGVASALETAGDQFVSMREDPRRLAKMVMLAAANWLLDAAALWVALRAFGVEMGVDGLLVSYGLANVLAALPITPGGLGVIEAVLIPTLIGFGGAASGVSVGVVAYRVIAFWLPIPIGSVCYVVIDRSKHDVRDGRTFVEDLVETNTRRSG